MHIIFISQRKLHLKRCHHLICFCVTTFCLTKMFEIVRQLLLITYQFFFNFCSIFDNLFSVISDKRVLQILGYSVLFRGVTSATFIVIKNMKKLTANWKRSLNEIIVAQRVKKVFFFNSSLIVIGLWFHSCCFSVKRSR